MSKCIAEFRWKKNDGSKKNVRAIKFRDTDSFWHKILWESSTEKLARVRGLRMQGV